MKKKTKLAANAETEILSILALLKKEFKKIKLLKMHWEILMKL